MENGEWKMENSSPWPRSGRPLAQSPHSPSSIRALRFALCSLRSIMNAVRAQPLTRLAAISDRDLDQVSFR